MRYVFRTDYRQDIALWRHRGDLFWYGLLCVVLLGIAIPYLGWAWLGIAFPFLSFTERDCALPIRFFTRHCHALPSACFAGLRHIDA